MGLMSVLQVVGCVNRKWHEEGKTLDSRVQGWAGNGSSELPCDNTRTSTSKLYLNLSQLTLHMSCHQHCSLMKFKKGSIKQKVSTAAAVKVKEPSTPSVRLFASCASAASHHDPILGSKVRAEQRVLCLRTLEAAELQITQVEPTGCIH